MKIFSTLGTCVSLSYLLYIMRSTIHFRWSSRYSGTLHLLNPLNARAVCKRIHVLFLKKCLSKFYGKKCYKNYCNCHWHATDLAFKVYLHEVFFFFFEFYLALVQWFLSYTLMPWKHIPLFRHFDSVSKDLKLYPGDV